MTALMNVLRKATAPLMAAMPATLVKRLLTGCLTPPKWR